MSTARELSQFASAITVDANNHIEFNSAYTVAMSGFAMPSADGTSGQLLITDGAGNLSFVDGATQSDITTAINNLVDSAPGTLDTLNELAAALGDDPNFATTVTNSIAAKMGNVVEDTTPQLGGTLDLNSQNIAGTVSLMSGTDELAQQILSISPNGYSATIDVNYGLSIGATTGFAVSVNAFPAIDVANTAAITFNNQYTFPTSDGANGQVLTTDGSGNLSFADASGGISNVVEDTTPQLGGDLDTNGNRIHGDGYLLILGDADLGANTASGNLYLQGLDSNSIGNGTVNINGVGGWYGGGTGRVNINWSGNNGQAYGDTYIGSINGGTGTGFYDNAVYINDSKFPLSRGSDGQVLTTDGAGILSWADAGGGGVVSTTTLDNPNAYSTSTNDLFGESVAISGDYAIVGTKREGDAGGTLSGKAYIFDVTTGALVHTLDNPNAYGTSATDYFGGSVAIDGNRAIVGAYLEDAAGNLSAGKAYIFDVPTGSLVYTLDDPSTYNTSANDYFGYSVAISDNYAIVSAKYEDVPTGTSSGKVYIFNVWTGSLVQEIDNPNAYNTVQGDEFGESVAISGNYAIVGASNEDDAGGLSSGKAYIFDVTTGALLHTLDNPNAYGTSGADNFGYSVAISGNYAIVGAKLEDDATGTDSGKAYIFDVTTGALAHTLDNPNAYGTSQYEGFGERVSISGKYAIVGAYAEDDPGGSSGDNSGKAYIFDVTTGSLVSTIDNPNAYGTSQADWFGRAVAISGNYAIVAAINEDDAGGTDSGKAYIFELALPFNKVSDDPAPKLGNDLDTKDFSITSTGDPDPNYGLPLVKIKHGLDIDSGLMRVVDGAGVLDISTKDGFSVYLRSSGDWSSTFPGGFFASQGSTVDTSSFSVYGKVAFNEYSGGYTFPFYDGTAGQVLTTDGAGNITFEDASGGISNLVEDTTPQLGGTLDLNGNSIVNTSNYNGGGIRMVPISTADYALRVENGAGDTILSTYGSNVYIKGLTYPAADGTNGQVLTTDGAGTLSFADAASGGGSFADRYVAAILFG